MAGFNPAMESHAAHLRNIAPVTIFINHLKNYRI